MFSALNISCRRDISRGVQQTSLSPWLQGACERLPEVEEVYNSLTLGTGPFPIMLLQREHAQICSRYSYPDTCYPERSVLGILNTVLVLRQS